jgi:hypothetical protein
LSSGITSGIVAGITSGIPGEVLVPTDHDQETKVRENRLRRAAERQGLRLEKSKRRDPNALDFGGYWLIDGPAYDREADNYRSRVVVVGGDYGTDLDGIEEYLTTPRAQR